jgi:hypothetical protein
MYFDPHAVQPVQCPRAYAADYNRIDFLIIERSHRIARSMRVVLVSVIDRCDIIGLNIHNHKYRRRTEMVIDGAAYSFIFLYGKTNLHSMYLLYIEKRLFKYNGPALGKGHGNLFPRCGQYTLNGPPRNAHTAARFFLRQFIEITEL